MDGQRACTEGSCESRHLLRDFRPYLQVLHFQSHLEILDVEAVWAWGRAWCQVTDRLDDLGARDLCYGWRAIPHVVGQRPYVALTVRELLPHLLAYVVASRVS